MIKLFSSLIKDTTRGDVQKLQPVIRAINDAESGIQALSDQELTSQFTALRQEIRTKYEELVAQKP
ncbi:MAG TPA: hypothetical protein VGE59_00335, partial [Patescibacteria group bacterium]